MNQVNGSSLLVNFLSITIEIKRKSAAFYAFFNFRTYEAETGLVSICYANKTYKRIDHIQPE